jgi:NADH dehydrogenase/NADH:ubiquinone oxidoreductase subunit G
MQVTINGRACTAEAGQTILQAARANGVYIPSLCYHEKLGALARCRVCMVEVQGMRGLCTSCSTFVQEGMVITTNSPVVLQAQKLIVDLLLSSGDHDCLSCEQNGACELQDVAYYLGIEGPSLKFQSINRSQDTTSASMPEALRPRSVLI